jgi:hypothetical protein
MDGSDDTNPPSMVAEGLISLRFLLGTWEGTGLCHGESIRGRLQITPLADGGFIEQRDSLLEAGLVVHEDLAIYRVDPLSQALRVQHFAPPGQLVDHYVLPDEEKGGIRWVAGPGAARIEIWPDGEELCLAVLLPGDSEPAQTMRYKRASAE